MNGLDRLLNLLAHTYPGWHIVPLRTPGYWYARRTIPPSKTLRNAGAIESLVRTSYPELLDALNRQELLTQRYGGYSYLRR
ncbi:hypothetical protein [Micrococcus luteus]|uniref:hypothetical protein n=1 Tax=Micrococcus luteus TaxID=1270 RepID=UPI003316B346